jgi:hypothetical protein
MIYTLLFVFLAANALHGTDEARMEQCSRHLKVLNLRQFEVSGVFPNQFDLDIQYPPVTVAIPIAIPRIVPHLDKTWPNCYAYRYNSAAAERSGYKVGLCFDLKETNAEWAWHRCILDLALNDGSIFPLFDGRLYRATLGDSGLLLTRVPDDCLANDRPQKSSLIIPGNCWQSRYFQTVVDSSKFGRRVVSLFIWSPRSVEFLDEEPPAMKLTWERRDEGEQVPDSDRKEYEELFKMPYKETTTFRKGDEFSTGYRRFKVLNVVPAGDLPNGGHCEGWVELDELKRPKPDEGKPTEKD